MDHTKLGKGRQPLGKLDVAVMTWLLVALLLAGNRIAVTQHNKPEQSRTSGRAIADWATYVAAGGGHVVFGSADAPVKVVVFSDFQCPACRRMVAALDSVEFAMPEQVAVIYRHFPLVGLHPQAWQTAVAAECAAVQGRFRNFYRVAFAAQDSLGSLDPAELARRASIPEEEAFDRCVNDSTQHEGILRDAAIAERLGVRGTPSFLINRHFIVGGDFARLLRVIQDELSIAVGPPQG